mmetsp:Transcript_20330/g.45955  ORF Transcript_20330/g.45955 Transcript_20330/m.45955 type:complete len:596 (+) Transcript_20330:91-1878(+)
MGNCKSTPNKYVFSEFAPSNEESKSSEMSKDPLPMDPSNPPPKSILKYAGANVPVESYDTTNPLDRGGDRAVHSAGDTVEASSNDDVQVQAETKGANDGAAGAKAASRVEPASQTLSGETDDGDWGSDSDGEDDGVCDVVVVGCGEPGKGMGWYHATQILEGLIPEARLTDVVEPFLFKGPGKETGPGKVFNYFAKEIGHLDGVRFHASLSTMPQVRSWRKKLGLIAGRSQDNPRFFREAIEKGCTAIYLEKPGAPTVKELEEMAAFAREQGVKVYMGYNKNVSPYMEEALAIEAKRGHGAYTTFYHNQDHSPDDLPELFEQNSEGMLNSMAVHELGLLVAFYGLTAANIKDVVMDRMYSRCLMLVGPRTNKVYTDFDKLGFTITTTQGRKAAIYADRCGGDYFEAVVTSPATSTSQGTSIEGRGKGRTRGRGGQRMVVHRAREPSKEQEAKLRDLMKERPDLPPYFLIHHDDYIRLKRRVCAAALVGDGGGAQGVSTIEGGIEALKLAEVLAPRLTKELFSIGYRKRRGLKGPEHAAATALPAWEMSLDESTRRGRIFKSKANSHRSTSTPNEFKTRMSRHELACLDPVSQDKI